MRKALLTAPLAVMLLMSSCQTVNEQVRIEDARAIYTAAVDAMTDLSKADLVDLDTLRQFDAIRKRVAIALSAAETAFAAGKEIDFSSVQVAMGTLAEILSIAQQAALEGGD